MSARLKALYDLQVIDTDLARAKKARAALDDGSALKSQVDAARTELKKRQDALHDAVTENQDKELSQKTIEVKIKSFRDKLYAGSVSNPKELSSMEKEIEMLGRNRSKLDERLLELMDIIEERKAQVANAETVLKDKEAEYSAHMAQIQRDATALTSRIESLTAQRASAAAAVDPALLKRYEDIRVRAGGIGVGRIESGSCGACHTQVMPYTFTALKSEDAVEKCENCGRILYLESR